MLIAKKPDLLDHCILFVETMEYGIHVQNMLIRHNCRFHTYYGEDRNHSADWTCFEKESRRSVQEGMCCGLYLPGRIRGGYYDRSGAQGVADKIGKGGK